MLWQLENANCECQLLPGLLGTKKGLEVFVKFLTKSGAFTKTGTPREAPTQPRLEEEDDEEDDGDEENDRWWEGTGGQSARRGDGSEGDEQEVDGDEDVTDEEDEGRRGE
ncbi:hypothetical protein LshimejAT787_0105710 [Lyophyllum shimeji]|uniref:Uncharacterized protein n=1 Tax=Lyophyllum shimeji TaxID=47721 RepID=A0A9P3UI37_LYOSH|nr:hypothetical protein LshimejAT787_0105710 [Lyophyllum shimeji]